MKIDKRNPWHWWYLVLSGCWAMLAIAARPLLPRRKPHRVLLYGHKLGGNLLALYQRLRETPDEFDVAFLTMDPAYYRELVKAGERAVLATSPRSIAWLGTARALVSDHGLHALLPMLFLSDVKFFDVWHGIPFKGFDADDFRAQHRYDETWVTSPLLKDLYVARYGFRAERVHATGNPRTDLLQAGEDARAAARRAFGLPEEGKLVLFAPTWKQDAKRRSLFPFGISEGEFLTRLAKVARRHGAIMGLRMHLNTGRATVGVVDGIVHLPFARYPDTERLLVATDILVCDWSSIAFDFMVLQRPTVFLDVEPPFRKGFSLDATYRHGEVVGSLEALEATLDRYLANPSAFVAEHGARARGLLREVYAGRDDGRATDRCIERMRLALR